MAKHYDNDEAEEVNEEEAELEEVEEEEEPEKEEEEEEEKEDRDRKRKFKMSHESMITVTFGHEKMKFKKGTSPSQVLKCMARLFPPRGMLLHVGEENLIVTSQEETLLQTEYIYQHPHLLSIANIKMLNAVLRLQVVKKEKLITYGTTVVCSKEGMCLIANHCLEAAGMRARDKHLRVGSHLVEIIARDVDM